MTLPQGLLYPVENLTWINRLAVDAEYAGNRRFSRRTAGNFVICHAKVHFRSNDRLDPCGNPRYLLFRERPVRDYPEQTCPDARFSRFPDGKPGGTRR